MRDHDELGPVGELAERLREPAHVALVERGVDLVKHAERRRPHAQDREQQRGCGQRALAAGKLVEAADALPGWPCVDVDPWLFWIVARAQRGLPAVEEPLKEQSKFAVDSLHRRAELLGDRGRELVRERPQIGHRTLEIALLGREELVTLPDLRELGRGERVHRLERDQPATKALQRGDRARSLLFIGFALECDARGIRKRLIVGQTELGADLLLQKAQRPGSALLFHRELSTLAADLGEPLARARETLLRLPARALRRERPLARQLRGPRRLARFGGRAAEGLLSRLESCTRVPLLRRECSQPLLLVGDASLGRADLLAQGIAQTD